LHSYNVPPEELTEIGMQQLFQAGKHIRDVYVTEKQFLDSSLSGEKNKRFEAYFRSDSADRCSQSATAMGYSLYPDGTGPRGFERQAIPVYMQLLKNEHEFAAPKGPCKNVMKEDVKKYAETRALELFHEKQDLLNKISDICGVKVEDIPFIASSEDEALGVKDIADMFTFDHDQGLPLTPGLTTEIRSDLEQLAFTNLMERYYSTPRMTTYWAGGFPDLLMKNLKEVAQGTKKESYKYYSYHGHRELLHGMGMMLGWKFDFAGLPTALGTSALHPGTTMHFELHERSSSYFVKTFVWSPVTNRTAVELDKCSLECPLEDFNQIMVQHIQGTGTWQNICDYHPENIALGHANTISHISHDAFTSMYIVLSAVGLTLLAVLATLIFRFRKRRNAEYRTLA